MKPSAENPEHVWVMTTAGLRKFVALQNQTFFRDPDNFGMYLYNDFHAYGITELVQNVLLDFDEAKRNWKEQWAVCEGTVMFFLHELADPMYMSEDDDHVMSLCQLLGTMFLAILATLERNDLLKPDSEIKSLRETMASWIQLANDSKWEDGFDNVDARIYAYATTHGINLSGSGMESRLEELKKTSTRGYKSMYTPVPGAIEGDSYDTTTWSSAERKKQSFNKDPLDKKALACLKEGLVMTPA